MKQLLQFAQRAGSVVKEVTQSTDVELAKLTTKRIRDWHTGLATASKLVRTGRIVKKARKSHAVDTKDVDAVRARRATANRTLTIAAALRLLPRLEQLASFVRGPPANLIITLRAIVEVGLRGSGAPSRPP